MALTLEQEELIQQIASEECEPVYEAQGADAFNACREKVIARVTAQKQRGGSLIELARANGSNAWKWGLGILGLVVIGFVVWMIVRANKGKKK